MSVHASMSQEMLQKQFDEYKTIMRDLLDREEDKMHRIRQAWLTFREEMDSIFTWSMDEN